MVANAARGDVVVSLKNGNGVFVDFPLRPTWQALCEIETALGKDFISIARDVSEGRLGMGLTATLVHSGMRAAGKHLPYATVAQMVYQTGLSDAQLLSSVDSFIVNALSGGREPNPSDPEDDEGKAAAVAPSPTDEI